MVMACRKPPTTEILWWVFLCLLTAADHVSIKSPSVALSGPSQGSK